MENLKKNIEGTYNFKNIVIHTIRKEKEGYTKSDEKTIQIFIQIKYPDIFEELMNEYNTEPNFGDNKTVNLKNRGNFINDISSGKINNKYDAEDEYIKKLRMMNSHLMNSI